MTILPRLRSKHELRLHLEIVLIVFQGQQVEPRPLLGPLGIRREAPWLLHRRLSCVLADSLSPCHVKHGGGRK